MCAVIFSQGSERFRENGGLIWWTRNSSALVSVTPKPSQKLCALSKAQCIKFRPLCTRLMAPHNQLIKSPSLLDRAHSTLLSDRRSIQGPPLERSPSVGQARTKQPTNRGTNQSSRGQVVASKSSRHCWSPRRGVCK